MKKRSQRQAQQAQIEQTQQTSGSTIPAAPAVAPVISRASALTAAPRVKLDAPELDGSISLKGARLDDLSLKNYRVEQSPTSPEVTLLNPQASGDGYFAVLGWTESGPGAADLPGADTLWTQISQGDLTPQNPLKLQYKSPDGLVFDRTITIDDHFMFAVSDSVANT